jgi:predicted ArsR family transcriptional regulator
VKNTQQAYAQAGSAHTADALNRADADASTRQRVAQSILEHGPSTAADLAGRLGLTAAAIRRHLDRLADEGMVTAREQRVYGSRGRGRPAKVFALTDAGRAGFYQAYDQLAIAALTALSETAGEEAIHDLGRRRMERVEERFRSIQADPQRSGLTPAQVLAAALSEEGYVASTQPAVAGEQVCQHHCPVAHVAEQFPQLCEMETETFSKLLSGHVQRLATIAHGDGVCTTHVPHLDQVRLDSPEPHQTIKISSTKINSSENHPSKNPPAESQKGN